MMLDTHTTHLHSLCDVGHWSASDVAAGFRCMYRVDSTEDVCPFNAPALLADCCGEPDLLLGFMLEQLDAHGFMPRVQDDQRLNKEQKQEHREDGHVQKQQKNVQQQQGNVQQQYNQEPDVQKHQQQVQQHLKPLWPTYREHMNMVEALRSLGVAKDHLPPNSSAAWPLLPTR